MRAQHGSGLLVAAVAATWLVSGNVPTAQGQQSGTIVTIDDMKSRTPADWVEQRVNRRFREKEFRLSAVGSDKDNAELIVYFFGTGQGGSVEDNVKRWKAQMVPPQGKSIDEAVKIEKIKVGSVAVTYFDVEGTYLFKERPFDPNTETIRRPNYRMVKVVFESPRGPYFFSLIGPADTVAHYKKGFDEWVKAFK